MRDHSRQANPGLAQVQTGGQAYNGPTSAPTTTSPAYFDLPRSNPPTRSSTTPQENMRPGPASASGHSRSQSNTLAHDVFYKSQSAHGHSSNTHVGEFSPRRMHDADGDYDRHAPLRSPNPPFASSSRAASPNGPSSDDSHSNSRYPPSRDNNHSSAVSGSGHSNHSYASINASSTAFVTPTASTSTLVAPHHVCAACHHPVSGQFVRALGSMYHLDCFRCRDCNIIVASKFFPIEGPDGRQQPLCETDYFRRLNLICGKCGMALRGSYITACNKKFHVEHFTCSVCPTLFGPQDSYYEHQNDVYCHFHYSIRFATRCVGCNSAILKQFVEINRNSRDECWHPECYMIHKFWNVKVASRPVSIQPMSSLRDEEIYAADEAGQTPASLKESQAKMEQKVFRIWTNLSAFEELSAACISDMLRHVSNGLYLEAIRMAEKFILHVEVLFAAIDELEVGFARAGAKGMSHVREARMLCRKTVDLFTLLSHTQDPNNPSSNNNTQRMGMTQELLALVTGLAHYLKILIRIALTGALKLEREHNNKEGLTAFLDHLHCLALEGGDPQARRLLRGGAPAKVAMNGSATAGPSNHPNTSSDIAMPGTEGVAYGYKSLSPGYAGESPFSPAAVAALANASGSSNALITPPSDLCVSCRLTVEEDCVRLGTYQRWHSHCVKCLTCGKVAAVPLPPKAGAGADGVKAIEGDAEKDRDGNPTPAKLTSARRPPANVDDFWYELVAATASSAAAITNGTGAGERPRQPPTELVPSIICCSSHKRAESRQGFVAVSRLEQYAFLLNVALRRLFLLLKKRGVMSLGSAAPYPPEGSPQRTTSHFRDASTDIMRMKQVHHLDRKLSATARLPKRSTIVESPAGKIAHTSDVGAQQPRVNQQYPQQPQQLQQPYQMTGYDGSQRSLQTAYGSTTTLASKPSQSNRSGGPPPRPPPPPTGLSISNYESASTSTLAGSTSAPLSPQLHQGAYPASATTATVEGHALRPAFARNNTQVYIVEERQPEPPSELDYRSAPQPTPYGNSILNGPLTNAEPSSFSQLGPGIGLGIGIGGASTPRGFDAGPTGANRIDEDEEGLTLGDIPQLLESEQAREQHRSLPRQSGKPLIAELTPLELLIVKHAAVLALQRSSLKDQFELDDILEMIEVKKATFWNKIFNKDKDRKNVKKKGVFGVPLELLAEREGADSMLGASRATLRIPSFIDDVVSAMKQMDMSIEGIFRKNGNIRRLKDLTDAIDRDPSSVDLTTENPVQLAALLKKFLRELPDPLLTFKLHKLWNSAVALPSENDRRRCLHILSIILPKPHRDTLEVLFVFLKWVASFAHVDEETGSKMDLPNLATVICPSILYAKGREAAREDSFTAIPVISQLLEEQDEFYTVPDEFLAILHDQEYFVNSMDMPAKEVLKKVDTYLRLKQPGRGQRDGGNNPQRNAGDGGMMQGRGGPGDGGTGANEARLMSQRSDPTLSRGRSPIQQAHNDNNLRNPASFRPPNHSRSRERQGQGQYDQSRGLPQHPGIPHQPFSSGPPSPRQHKPDPSWPGQATSPRPAPIPNNSSGTRSGAPASSRPSSMVRSNGEGPLFPLNGRHSPGRY